MYCWRLLFLVVFALFASSAYAQNRTVIQAIGPLGSSDPLTLRGNTWPDPDITVTCYYGTSVPQSLCAGGGDFDRVAYTVSPCTSTGLDNGGTIIQDLAHNCYYRKNFGLNGVVDARQCGVHGTGAFSDQDAAELQTCLDLAKANHIPIVNTGGGRVRDDQSMVGGHYGQDILVPGGITLTCGGGSALGQVTDNNFTNTAISPALPIQHVLILDGAHTIRAETVADGGTDDGSSAALDGCVVLRADENGADAYAPSLFLPSGAGNLRASLNVVSSFRGTAITANTEAFTVKNTIILGFAQCWYGSGARMLVTNAKCDGTAGFWADKSGGGITLTDTQIRPFLTGNGFTNANCANCSSYTWTAVSLSQDGTAYRIVIDKSVLSTVPQNGDTVWVTAPNNHVQSAGGRYENITGVTNTSSCPSGNCEYFDLPGSVFSSSSSKISATAMFSPGSNVLTGLSIDVRKLAVGMGVDSNSGCVQGAKIVDINPAWNTVWITPTAPTICDSGTNNSVRFWDDGDTSPSSGTLTLAATERTGDAYKITNTGGVTFSNCRQLGHYVGFHVGDSANLTRFMNCANDNDSSLQDDALIGLLCDGMHQGNDCSDTDWVNGVLGQHATNSIVVNSDSTHALHVVNAGVGPTDGRQRGRYADMEAGVLAMDNSSAGKGVGGNIFVSGGLNLVTLKNLGTGYAGGDVLTESDSSSTCSIHAQITIDTVNSGVPATWHQSRQGVCTTWPTNSSMGWTLSGGSGTASGSWEGTTAQLAMSNVVVPGGNLYLQDSTAAANTTGCGNIFEVPVPFTCVTTPSTQMPGGRLALPQASPHDCTALAPPPVMTADVTGATCVFYVPYVSQQVLVYNLAANTFAPVDIGPTGLALNLDSTSAHKQLAGTLYDIFLETVRAGLPELCVGPGWSSSTSRGTGYNSAQLTLLNGVWVNAAGIAACQYDSGNSKNVPCPIYACTYLGTMYMTANGQTSQQFSPAAASGGSAPCLCLYNAYNHVTVSSQSLDSQGTYTYNSATWRVMGNPSNPPKNNITVLDGLGQMPVSGKLSDGIKGSSGTTTGGFGINFNATTGAPPQIAQSSSTATSTYDAILVHAPQMGLWTAQAMEWAPTGSVTFGGSGLQQLSVQVAD